jgi:hypothetical protein
LHKKVLCNVYIFRVTRIIKLRELILTGHALGIRNEKCKQNFYLKTYEELRLQRGYYYEC